jgi:hypothetical protein
MNEEQQFNHSRERMREFNTPDQTDLLYQVDC